MEGEELAAELRRTQESLTSLQAEMIPTEPAYPVSAVLGASWPNSPAMESFSSQSESM